MMHTDRINYTLLQTQKQFW